VYRHMHSNGVGAGHDWCRLWWHKGAWRIGHVSWISGDRMLNVAHVKSNAMWPGGISPPTCNWRQHKGQACGRDYSGNDADFKEALNITVGASSGSTDGSSKPRKTDGKARKINPQYNAELNSTARNTNDVKKIRRLVNQGADLLSTNGPMWRHTPLHQAAYHGRPTVVKVLIELSREQGVLEKLLDMDSNPCGRGARGTPIELARGGGHTKNVRLLEEAARSLSSSDKIEQAKGNQNYPGNGRWEEHQNIDMCGKGDIEIISNWRASHSIEDLKRIVEKKGYSAISVGGFGHAALKKFNYQLTSKHCARSRGYTNQLFIYFPGQSEGISGNISNDGAGDCCNVL